MTKKHDKAEQPAKASQDPRPINRDPLFAPHSVKDSISDEPDAASVDAGAVAFKPGQTAQRITPDAVEGTNRTMGGASRRHRSRGAAPDDGAAEPLTKAPEDGFTHGDGEAGEGEKVEADGDLEGDGELPDKMPSAVKLNAPHGFVDKGGKHHFWAAGAYETDPHKVELLLKRKADVTLFDKVE